MLPGFILLYQIPNRFSLLSVIRQTELNKTQIKRIYRDIYAKDCHLDMFKTVIFFF